MSVKKKRIVRVSDRMQTNYTYELSAPVGRHFDSEFTPQLTPKEMLELGVFGGIYMRDCRKEFPASWFAKAKFAPLSTNEHIKELNYFGENASQPLSVWRRKGWIYKDDPRGWFQWYCRYYMGRRLPEEDKRQVRRWRAIKRHITQVKNNCSVGDGSCRPRQRQVILHWAYDSRKL